MSTIRETAPPTPAMHVLMLGWEFPPYITGGLGTACHGLTRALDGLGVRVTFMLPRPISGDDDAPVTLVGPAAPPIGPLEAPPAAGAAPSPAVPAPTAAAAPPAPPAAAPPPRLAFDRVRFIHVASPLVHPYGGGGPVAVAIPDSMTTDVDDLVDIADAGPDARSADPADAPPHGPDDARTTDRGRVEYGGDLIEQTRRYAEFCCRAARRLDFDVIHAHDWMTYPAGLAIARATGRPLVAHCHSTEFDRAGEDVNQRVYDIERRGLHGALRVIAVSQLTRNTVVARYGVPDDRVEVVYNGVDLDPARAGLRGIRGKDKIVLYFGRITFQKGPEYFLRAAKRVLEVMDDVKFVVAGSGDMARDMIETASAMGIGHKVLFTGFLRGADIGKVFHLADLYVMPSVSEPFGIAPLEAMGHDVPVLISRTSGVSEVLSHVLKVDFWDVDDMANKIVAVLRHPPLSQTLKTHGAMEVRGLTWGGAAERCEQVYRSVIAEMPTTA